jgi:hypothetical protein
MKRPSAFPVITILVALAALVSFFLYACGLPPIAPHRGDGQFQDISHRAGPFRLRGYTISMPEFDLGQPHQQEYRLADLPELGPECGVHLAVRGRNGGWGTNATRLNGELRLELINSKGNVVVNVSGKLGDYTWWGFGDMHALYQLRRSFFRPDRREEYRLRFSYTPDPKLAGYRGFVYLRCGGSM